MLYKGKSFCKTSFQVGMDLKKVQKQGRDERTQEDYPKSAVYFCRCRVVFLRSFISTLFLYFFQLHLYLKSSFTETFFPSFCSFFGGFKVTSKLKTNVLLCWRPARFALEMNTLVLETYGRGDDYSQVLYLRKRVESRSSTHHRVYATSTSYIYTTAFSAGLNGLQ